MVFLDESTNHVQDIDIPDEIADDNLFVPVEPGTGTYQYNINILAGEKFAEAGFENFHKITAHDQVHLPKFWHM